MRDIKTLTKEEVEEFLNVISLGEFADYKIISMDYIDKDHCVRVEIETYWENLNEDGSKPVIPIIIPILDTWYFYQCSYDTTYPNETYDSLYSDFALVKGFRENVFSK